MHDIRTIDRLNAEAVERSVPHQLAAGKHLVLHYTGLHFVGSRAFETQTEAVAEQAMLDANKFPGERFEVRSPALA